MKPGFFAFLVLILAVTLSPPAYAAITGDIDGDGIVSEAELTALILEYLDASPVDSSISDWLISDPHPTSIPTIRVRLWIQTGMR